MKESVTVRLDRWLSAARFFKTRTQAASACEGGKVKINGVSAKPHKAVHVGDEMTLHVRGRYRNIRVLGLAERGLPPAEARKLFEELVSQKLSEEELELIGLYKELNRKNRSPSKGRPTKKVRRQMDRWKDQYGGS